MKPRILVSYAIVLITTVNLLTSCSSIPKEVVELSYLAGRDLQSLQTSYDNLVHQFYDNLREQRRVYLDEQWFPRFLENWREEGELVAIAKGDRIWSEEAEDLIDTPAGTNESESLATLRDWVQEALYAYQEKEMQLTAPLDAEEQTLRAEVRQSFDQLAQANATITAHLNSLREVQEVQDGMLEALDIKDLRDRINTSLESASTKAAEGLEAIKKADAKVDEIADKI